MKHIKKYINFNNYEIEDIDDIKYKLSQFFNQIYLVPNSENCLKDNYGYTMKYVLHFSKKNISVIETYLKKNNFNLKWSSGESLELNRIPYEDFCLFINSNKSLSYSSILHYIRHYKHAKQFHLISL
jgi:hypothetical protein